MNFTLPHIGEGVHEVELLRWLVKPGDTVKAGDPLMEVMTDKATTEVPAPFAGTVSAFQAEPGQKITVGQTVLSYEPAGQPVPVGVDSTPRTAAPPAESAPASAPAPLLVNGTPAAPVAVKAAPSVRQMARKLGIDISNVTGSGPEGRILVEDLTRHVRPTIGRDMPPEKPASLPEEYGRPGTRIRMQGVRRKIADRMVHAKRTIPHYTYVDECDVSELVRLRASLKDVFDRANVRLTYLPFFVKAVVAALKEVPVVNASLDEEANEIVLHDGYHIGIAVATPNGLVVPVVRDADRKDLGTVAREIYRLSNDARMGRSKLEDLRGGTFTLTSVGNIGGLFSTPVINHPEVGILGIGKVVRRPVFNDAGEVVPADIVYLSLSFDHRVVDGAVGAAFTNAIIRHLRNPVALLLPEKL